MRQKWLLNPLSIGVTSEYGRESSGVGMILPDLILKTRQNQSWKFSGVDSLEHCRDQNHFKNYPYDVTDQYNSRGFRDTEWPKDLQGLKQAIWCIGDSFTVGLGSPLEHTWPWLLQQQTGIRTINVSMDGASNHWIARKANQIIDKISPTTIIIHWSYIWRSEDLDSSKTDEQRRNQFDDSVFKNDNDNFIKILQQFKDLVSDTKIIHSVIPEFSCVSRLSALHIWKQLQGPDWPELPSSIDGFNSLNTGIATELKKFNSYDDFNDHFKFLEQYNSLEYTVPEFEKMDLARDGHHYDKITATNFVAQLLSSTAFPRQQ